LRRRQVLEVVAEEGEVEVFVGEDVGELQAAGADEAHVPGQVGVHWPDVGGPPLARLDVADEVAGVTRDVDDPRVGFDVALKELAELLPDRVLGRPVLFVKPEVVDLLEDDRGRLVRDRESFWGCGHGLVATTLTLESADSGAFGKLELPASAGSRGLEV